MPDDAQQLARLHEALTGSPKLDGKYDDALMGRLLVALDAAWALVTARGDAAKVTVVAGDAAGPWAPPASLLDDCNQQVRSRWRHDDKSRWRTMAEAAQQLSNLMAVLSQTTPVPTSPSGPSPAQSWPDALWVGTIPAGATTVGNGGAWGNVQRQRIGGNIVNKASGIRVVDHKQLGRALEMRLNEGELRAEVQAAGSTDEGWVAGTERWCGFNLVLADDFPLSSNEPFAIVSQVHQASGSGSPPLEFNARSGALWIRGSSTGFNRKVCDLQRGVVYRIVFGLKLGNGKGASTLNVYVNGALLVQNYKPPVDFGPPAYWKVASAYASSRTPRPFVTFQNGHRIGATYKSVA